MYDKFLQLLYDRDVLKREYYDSQLNYLNSDENVMHILYNTLTECKYPKPPHENAEKSRKFHKLNYV